MSASDAQRAALEIVATRVREAHALIEATGRLRRTLDRYDWFTRRWYSYRSVGVNTSTLKLLLVGEFEAVSSAARKLGGRRVTRCARVVDAGRGLVLGLIDPPNDSGISDEDGYVLMQAVNDLRDAATRAAQRSRWLQGSVVAALLIAAAIGFVLGFLLAWLAR